MNRVIEAIQSENRSQRIPEFISFNLVLPPWPPPAPPSREEEELLKIEREEIADKKREAVREAHLGRRLKKAGLK